MATQVGKCPFCRLEVQKDDAAQTIAHESPVCPQFEALASRGNPEVCEVQRESLPAHFSALARRVRLAKERSR
jgi:hypothetical protein